MDLRDRPPENAAVTGRLNLAFPALRRESQRSSNRSLSGSDIPKFEPHPKLESTTPPSLLRLATMTQPNNHGASVAPPASMQGLYQDPEFHVALHNRLVSFDNKHGQLLNETPLGHDIPLQEAYTRARQAMTDYWVLQYHLTGKLPKTRQPSRPSQFQLERTIRPPPGLSDIRTSSVQTSDSPTMADVRKPQYQLHTEAQAQKVVAAVWNTYSSIGVGSLDVHEEETDDMWEVRFRVYKNQNTPRWKPEEVVSGCRPVVQRNEVKTD